MYSAIADPWVVDPFKIMHKTLSIRLPYLNARYRHAAPISQSISSLEKGSSCAAMHQEASLWMALMCIRGEDT